MTTRKTAAPAGSALAGLAVLAGAALGAAGCATPGVLHVYSMAAAEPAVVHDAGGEPGVTVPSFLAENEQLTGFAYDPYTDHFFLRLAPGNAMRVVDRPARAIKREFPLEGVPATGGGDLAVKPRTGQLFLLHPTEPAILETTRLGGYVRTITLGGAISPPAGVAYDAARDTLLVLHNGNPAVVAVHALDGTQLGTFTLERAVGPALAFDAEQRELYAPLAGEARTVGVFDESGRLQRTVTAAVPFIDVGPRSFIRVF